MSPGRWLGLVAVQDLLHQLLSREAGAAVPVAASPLDAINCRKRGGDRDVSQTATQTSGRRIGTHHLTSSLYWHCKGETASCSLIKRSTDMADVIHELRYNSVIPLKCIFTENKSNQLLINMSEY